MKYLNLIGFLILIICCENDPTIKVDSRNSIDTIYDVSRGELVHETEDTLWFEPYERRIPKVRKIFKQNKNYVYSAEYRDEKGNLLSNSKIKLIPSGKRFSFAPERQDMIKYEYENYQEDENRLENHDINKESRFFREYSEEGIVENVEGVWIHPIRGNQYLFTEVAPFPKVQLPLEIDKEWDSNLNIGKGWGEWENTSGESTYKVVRKDTFSIAENYLDCWLIESQSIFPFGVSKLSYKFNENYGFVMMNYINYKNETLNIRMIKVEEE